MSHGDNAPLHARLIVLGSGPAGYTAAIYAARAMLEPVLIAGFEAGGQLMITTDVENYPGFPKGIMGPELMQEFRKQAERFGARFVSGDVTKVELKRTPIRLIVNDEESYESRTLIICTGASAKLLSLESESKLMGHGVS
ncbi:MAG: FAD-dependent oxidoreductase, partial [Methylocystis sp.]|nr:FAD-dependent oxidoreductase [Methylocystis sp.]